jgi:DNA polymerase III alpha subunit (gram-positive type)
MRLCEITESSDSRKTNKMLYFRQTVDSIIDKIKGKTIVVFDTETSGLSALLPWVQVTEIAAIAIDADSGRVIDKFHRKINLTPETKAEISKQKKNIKDGDRGSLENPKGMNIPDLFKMSKYGEKNTQFKDIKEVYSEWLDFLSQFDHPVMLGQNAAFDMGHMFAPLKKLGLPRPQIGEVMDTMIMARTWIYPLLKAAADAGGEASADMLSKFDTVRNGKTSQSFTLGKLGQAFDVSGEHWHSGISDAMQTYGIFNKMIQFLKTAKEQGHEDSDVFKQWHAKMSGTAFNYGKRPAFGSTVKSDTKKGIQARGRARI